MSFEQHDELTPVDPSTSAMYQSILSNYGSIPGYEALITRSGIGSLRCTVAGCPPLVSSNAKVTYWSPNTIKLQRLAPGPISLNLNPSSYWLVNGKRLFPYDKVAEPDKPFVITDPSATIVLQMRPSLRL